MSWQSILGILISVALSSGSQILLKKGMMATSVQSGIQSGDAVRIFTVIATSPLIVGGLFSFGLSAVVWLFVLSKVPLSTAYPFVALGMAVTVAAGAMMFGETVGVYKSIGVGLVILGILFIATKT